MRYLHPVGVDIRPALMSKVATKSAKGGAARQALWQALMALPVPTQPYAARSPTCTKPQLACRKYKIHQSNNKHLFIIYMGQYLHHV